LAEGQLGYAYHRQTMLGLKASIIARIRFRRCGDQEGHGGIASQLATFSAQPGCFVY
jgi:hypothetical protein